MGIEVEQLTKTYGSQKAVDDISFRVKTGEILGFLGPNGAGKSTTMKIITCFIKPTNGTVKLDGIDIHEDPLGVRKKIGYLPENTPLYQDMSIIDYLAFTAGLQQVERREIQKRIREMIDVCGLGPEKYKYIGELSKGYRQRVGLAQALIHDPDILILDEPTTGLDPNQIAEIRDLIKEIGKEKTVMLSSHILKEVEATCDRIIIINRGKLVADGSTEELTKKATGAGQFLVDIKPLDGKDDIKHSLLTLSSVSDVLSENGLWRVISKPDLPVQEEIFRLCVDKNWILMQLTPVESSLEDVFRELTVNQTSN